MKTSVKLIFTSVLISFLAGCSSYGGQSQPVRVSESQQNQTIELLAQIRVLEQENEKLRNQSELQQRELADYRGIYNQGGSVPNTGQVIGQANGQVNSQVSGQANGQFGNPVTPEFSGTNAAGIPANNNGGFNTQNNGQVNGQVNGQTNSQANGQFGNNQGSVNPVAVPPLTSPGQIDPNTIPSTANVGSTISAEALYDQGFNSLKEGKYNEAISAFQTLVAQYPTNDLADDAQYWTGESYYVNGQFDQALNTFNSVVSNFPKSERTPEAHLKIGYIYADRGDNNNARQIFNSVISLYPNDRAAVSAKSRLSEL